MHFVVNICFSFFSIHWFFHSLCPRMLLRSLMKLLYSLRFLTLFLHCCQSLLYSCTFSVQKLCLISGRSIKSSGILSPDGTIRPTKSHALGVSLTHLSVISRSHAWHLPYYANLTHFSQKSSKWAWFADLRMRSSQFNELAQEFAVLKLY